MKDNRFNELFVKIRERKTFNNAFVDWFCNDLFSVGTRISFVVLLIVFTILAFLKTQINIMKEFNSILEETQTNITYELKKILENDK
jgi:hypothetical protein